MLFRYIVRKKDGLWFCLVIFGAAAFILVSITYSEFLVFRRFSVLFESGDRSMRIFLFTNALQLWLQDVPSFFFGIGPQGFPRAIGADSPGMYPHNFLLESLCEYGFLGFLMIFFPFLLIGLVYIKKILTNRLTDSSTLTLAALTLLFFTVSMGTGSLASVWPLIFLVSALVPSPTYKNKDR